MATMTTPMLTMIPTTSTTGPDGCPGGCDDCDDCAVTVHCAMTPYCPDGATLTACECRELPNGWGRVLGAPYCPECLPWVDCDGCGRPVLHCACP